MSYRVLVVITDALTCILRAWYNNLALIYMVHMGNNPKMFGKAMEIVRNGLEDPESRLGECSAFLSLDKG